MTVERTKTNAPEDSKRPTKVMLSEALVAEADTLGVNLSQAAEQGLLAEIARARGEQWVERNRAAMESWNEYVARNGLPLDDLRVF